MKKEEYDERILRSFMHHLFVLMIRNLQKGSYRCLHTMHCSYEEEKEYYCHDSSYFCLEFYRKSSSICTKYVNEASPLFPPHFYITKHTIKRLISEIVLVLFEDIIQKMANKLLQKVRQFHWKMKS